LGFIPSHQFHSAEVPFWNNIQTPLPKHTWDMHIIAVWNTKGKKCLNASNKNWLKELAKETAEAKWETNCIHSDPYPFALSTENILGLINKVITLRSSSSNPTRPPRLRKYPGQTLVL
jgi:hypothetical protein